MARKITREEAIDIIREVHGDRYMGIDDIDYVDTHTKFMLTCPEHGDFLITLKSIKEGRGCPKCGHQNGSEKKRYNTDSFKERAKAVHGDRYDYSKVNYINSTTKVCIICPEHGEFWQEPSAHLRGQGCPMCGIVKNAVASRKSDDEFIGQARKIHGDRYDYSKVEYINSDTKVRIICPVHGEFLQTPYNHLKGQGCPSCAKEKTIESLKDTVEDFVEKARNIHGDRYDYSKVVYNKSKDKVEIICRKHGSFYQLPNNHLMGCGCPVCGFESIDSVSEAEREMNSFIREIYDGNIIFNDRNVLSPYELDVYLPEKNIAFEFDGLYWHNEINKADRDYHLKKTNACEKQGIQLIHIFEDEWIYKKDIVKSRIRNILGVSLNRVGARQCDIRVVSKRDAAAFLNENHIQGSCYSLYNYGLYYHDELVSIMTFGKLRRNMGRKSKDGCYELLRFANRQNYSVVGAASKLLEHFKKSIKFDMLISYADRRWSNGNLYRKIGFEEVHTSQPNYFYIIGNRRRNRFNYRKDVLVSEGFDSNKTEHQIMLERKIYRIYDCGSILFEYKNGKLR